MLCLSVDLGVRHCCLLTHTQTHTHIDNNTLPGAGLHAHTAPLVILLPSHHILPPVIKRENQTGHTKKETKQNGYSGYTVRGEGH